MQLTILSSIFVCVYNFFGGSSYIPGCHPFEQIQYYDLKKYVWPNNSGSVPSIPPMLCGQECGCWDTEHSEESHDMARQCSADAGSKPWTWARLNQGFSVESMKASPKCISVLMWILVKPLSIVFCFPAGNGRKVRGRAARENNLVPKENVLV